VSQPNNCPAPKKRYRLTPFAFAAACLGLSLSAVVAVVFLLLPPAPVKDDAPPPAPVASAPAAAPGEDAHYFGGWLDIPEGREEVRTALPPEERWFGDTPAGRAVMGDDQDVLLSDGVRKFLGQHLPARDQGRVGSCVSFGSTTAIEYLIILQALSQGLPLDAHKELVQEAMYGLSRVEIGGGRIRGDGSVTAWAGEAAKRYGVLPKGVYGRLDLTRYDENRCRDWGRSGLPDELEPITKQSPVKGISFARSADEMAKAIRQAYPIAIGSRVGFGSRGPWTRDKDGFLRASGTWGHCMAVVGVIGGPRPGFLFVNSWGTDWVRGPTGKYDMPPGSFFVDWATADRMAREGDCIVFSDAVGFPTRNPWFILKDVPAPARGRGRDVVFAPELAP
jgi:hypothetical protein